MLQNPQLHYLDNAATTIVAPEVADVIDKAMREHWANPSSLYGPVLISVIIKGESSRLTNRV